MSKGVTRPVALTVAGSDSGGGAGIQADLRTFHAFGVFGTTAVTAVTVQNTLGVRAVQKIDPEIVAGQIRAVAEDLRPAAVKSGMLADAAIIEAVAATLERQRLERYVLDPVMVAKSGDRLLEERAVGALGARLLPLSEVVTPNLDEAALLVGASHATPPDAQTRDDDDPERALEAMRSFAERLVQRGARAALIKGGHLRGPEVIDVYFDGSHWEEWRRPRHRTRHTHGTGCTLSAAICAGLALGLDRLDAVSRAIDFTVRAIETAPGLGEGHGPLNHWTASSKFDR